MARDFDLYCLRPPLAELMVVSERERAIFIEINEKPCFQGKNDKTQSQQDEISRNSFHPAHLCVSRLQPFEQAVQE